MTNRLIRVLHIHATKQDRYTREEDTTRTQRLLQHGWMVDQDQLQQYELLKVDNVHRFNDVRGRAELERLAEKWQVVTTIVSWQESGSWISHPLRRYP